jgi:alanyl-tRNA synthetase
MRRKKKGAMALFGEKYENEVRVVKINEFSMELCGGTHVSRIGEIGSFFIIHETAIASGIRRIEAITGPEFIKYAQNNRSIINLLVKQLNVTIPEIPQRVNFLNNQIKDLEKDLHKIQTNQVVENIDDLIQKEEKIGSVKLVVHNFYNTDMESLKKVADLFRQQADNGIILLINSTENKLNFVCAITDDLIKNKNLNAGELIRQVAKITGGSGGGRAHLATAGGKEISKLNDAIHHLKQLLMKI